MPGARELIQRVLSSALLGEFGTEVEMPSGQKVAGVFVRYTDMVSAPFSQAGIAVGLATHPTPTLDLLDRDAATLRANDRVRVGGESFRVVSVGVPDWSGLTRVVLAPDGQQRAVGPGWR